VFPFFLFGIFVLEGGVRFPVRWFGERRSVGQRCAGKLVPTLRPLVDGCLLRLCLLVSDGLEFVDLVWDGRADGFQRKLFGLLKPTNWIFLGSESSCMFNFGCQWRTSPSFSMCLMAVDCSSCGEASSIVFIGVEWGNMSKISHWVVWNCVVCDVRKSVSASSPGAKGTTSGVRLRYCFPQTLFACV
jgi:hypothetical protein